MTALVVVGLCSACPKNESVHGEGFRFTPVDEGIEYARFFVPVDDGAAAFDGHAFRFELDSVTMRVLPAGGPTTRREVSVITRSLPSVVATNGSFFAEDGRAMGLVVDDSALRGRRRVKPWSALVVKEGRAHIVKGADVDLKTRPTLVLQGQPRLIENGEIAPLKPQVARRTAVCLPRALDDGSPTMILVVTSPVDLPTFARTLARPTAKGGLGCTEALNLDGGPSTQLVARLGDFSVEVKAGDDVPNALAVTPGRRTVVATSAPVIDDDGAIEPTGDAHSGPDAGGASGRSDDAVTTQ